jgi:hypothetical protein
MVLKNNPFNAKQYRGHIGDNDEELETGVRELFLLSEENQPLFVINKQRVKIVTNFLHNSRIPVHVIVLVITLRTQPILAAGDGARTRRLTSTQRTQCTSVTRHMPPHLFVLLGHFTYE